jgi:predicted RNase H-like HicB family nuclease
MRMELTAVFQEAPEGGYVAFALEMPGAASQGETLEEARDNLEDAIRLLIETRRDLFEREHAGEPLIRQPLLIDEAA